MKAILTILLILTAVKPVQAQPRIIYSQVCNYDYVEGVKVRRASGQVVRECLKRNRIGNEYLTDKDTACDSGFVPGILLDVKGAFDAKVCLKSTSLGEVYETDYQHGCDKNYRSDKMKIFNNTTYPSIYCVRHF